MTSVGFLCRVAPMLLVVIVAHLALLQYATTVEAGPWNHLDYVSKKGETRADKRGARLPTVKKELEPDEEVAAVELEPVDDEDADGDASTTTSRPTGKSRSGVGAFWTSSKPRHKSAGSKLKAEKDDDADEDDEDKVVDPLNHEAESKRVKGGSRADMSSFDVEEKEEGQAPMVVLKIHPVDSKKASGGSASAKPTLSPSMDKLVKDNQGKTGPNGTVVITIKPDLSMVEKLNKTGEVQGFGTIVTKTNSSSASGSSASSSASSSSSTLMISDDGSVIEKGAGTTTRIPTFKISTTPKSAPSSKKKTANSVPKLSTAKPSSKKPTTGKPASGKMTTGKPSTKKPTSTKAPTPADCPCMTAKPSTTAKPARPTSSTKKPGASTNKPAAKSTTKKPATSAKPKLSSSTKNERAGRCTARPDCQCNYQELKDTDKMLAVVITKRGGFKGRRLNSKAIAKIMAGKVGLQEMLDIQAQKSILVSSNNTYVLPAGHYYFPNPIRFAGFVSP